MVGQRVLLWSVRFERFSWGFTVGLVFLLFAGGPALLKLLAVGGGYDVAALTLQLAGGSLIIAYGFGFTWSMFGQFLWDIVLQHEYEQYSFLNGYIGAVRSWSRTMGVAALTTLLIIVTGLDPFATVRDAELGVQEFGLTVAQQLPAQLAADVAGGANQALAEAAQQVQAGGQVQPPTNAIQRTLAGVTAGTQRFLRAQADRSLAKARTAVEQRFNENLMVLSWLPVWAIAAAYALGHWWFPLGLLTWVPSPEVSGWLDRLKWRPKRRVKLAAPSGATGARAADMVTQYTAPRPPIKLPPGLPPAQRTNVQEGEWREVDDPPKA